MNGDSASSCLTTGGATNNQELDSSEYLTDD